MNTLAVGSIGELALHIGETLGPSRWLTIDQAMIDDFARITNDHSWYHVDIERAAREMPGGRTIAHGHLIASLVPGLTSDFLTIRDRGRALNYGSDKVRFVVPVVPGDAVRLTMTLAKITPAKGGSMLQSDYVMELRGAERPALIAEILTLMHD